MKNIRLSLYSQGGTQSAVYFYRFQQYLPQICSYRHNKQLSDRFYSLLMPIGQKGFLLKCIAFIVIVIRVSVQLLIDTLFKPDFIVISRTLVNRWYPSIFNSMILKMKKKGSKIIWDIDDDILEIGEINVSNYEFMWKYSDIIIVATKDLYDVLPVSVHDKILILPTTDGTMYKKNSMGNREHKIEILKNKVILLWVGTSSGLSSLERIMPQIEKAASILSIKGKQTELCIVSNENICYVPRSFRIVYQKWTRDVAENAFLNAHIGLMPLFNNQYSKGKGGCKLLQYLSVGLPSIATGIGINSRILSEETGFLAPELDSDAWSESIVKLGSDIDLWKYYSDKSVDRYKNKYSSDYVLYEWRKILRK